MAEQLSKSSGDLVDPFDVDNDEFPTIINESSQEKMPAHQNIPHPNDNSITKDVQLFLDKQEAGQVVLNTFDQLTQKQEDKSSISILPEEE